MSGRVSVFPVIEEEPPQQCDDCGKIRELRPYGPKGTKICHECGQKDPEGTRKRLGRKLFGDPIAEEGK